ncbi:MAG: type II toxin-antitoxin system VapC family toxin [Chloroflexi bacterium]|nr:type II toxin-antitoxin system VapC family toxin [Chloroflexota bacterium]
MIVVDASVVAKWLFIEPHSDRAVSLLATCARHHQQIVAPALLSFEITNIVRQRMRRDGLGLAEAQGLLTDFTAFPIVMSAPSALSADALTLAATYDLPATYDAHYLALTQHLGCDLWTGDRRLLNQLAGRLTNVRWIGDYATK